MSFQQRWIDSGNAKIMQMVEQGLISMEDAAQMMAENRLSAVAPRVTGATVANGPRVTGATVATLGDKVHALKNRYALEAFERANNLTKRGDIDHIALNYLNNKVQNNDGLYNSFKRFVPYADAAMVAAGSMAPQLVADGFIAAPIIRASNKYNEYLDMDPQDFYSTTLDEMPED